MNKFYDTYKNIECQKIQNKSKLYPFREMEIGDSFFVKCDYENRFKKQSNITTSARQRKNMNAKFTTRIVEGGVRCWRIE